eukprot:m.563657 g.563657  ORF g.563657 m.563657 type:complete len:114 (+) comp57813_c1_seq43:1370-1711(+)
MSQISLRNRPLWRDWDAGVALSSDFITGFCGETEEDHAETLSLMEQVQYDMAFMFAYSMRPRTHAHHRMQDDVPEPVKSRRLQEIIDVFHRQASAKNARRSYSTCYRPARLEV